MTAPVARPPGVTSVAFVVPGSGPTGMYGPSCRACAQLAVEQIDAGGGILSRPVELVEVDAGQPPERVAAEVELLVQTGRVDAIAGWHISAVRQAVARRVGGQVVYAYAAMHEGGEDVPGLYLLGERPVNQLLPAAAWVSREVGASRWAIVGNDYVFPRVSGAVARERLGGLGARVVAESYLPLGTERFGEVLASIRDVGADGVLMLLMGQDAVHFNRQFARAGLDRRVVRLSSALDETTIIGGGLRANANLYASAAFFDALGTSASRSLGQAYAARFGPVTPPLNAIGESCYEALHFLAGVAAACGSLDVATVQQLTRGWVYQSPRGEMRLRGNVVDQDVYIARADGLELTVQDRITQL